MIGIGEFPVNDLLPCPFCGSAPRLENYVVEAAVFCSNKKCGADITCKHGARDERGFEDCKKAWNRRAFEAATLRNRSEVTR